MSAGGPASLEGTEALSRSLVDCDRSLGPGVEVLLDVPLALESVWLLSSAFFSSLTLTAAASLASLSIRSISSTSRISP